MESLLFYINLLVLMLKGLNKIEFFVLFLVLSSVCLFADSVPEVIRRVRISV